MNKQEPVPVPVRGHDDALAQARKWRRWERMHALRDRLLREHRWRADSEAHYRRVVASLRRRQKRL